MLLTKEIVRAARAMLSWSQPDLADKSGISIGTIARFESDTSMHGDTMDRIVTTLKKAGIEFILDKHGRAIGLKKTK